MLGQIEPFYYSLYSVIFRRTILFFLLGYSNYLLSRECWRNPITQKKPAIQRILNTPMGQILCITGFLDMNNKRVDRSIVSMLRSMFGGGGGSRTPVRKHFLGNLSGRRRLFTFPYPGVSRHTRGLGSFIVHGMLKALHTHGHHFVTPRPGSWSFRAGRPH